MNHLSGAHHVINDKNVHYIADQSELKLELKNYHKISKRQTVSTMRVKSLNTEADW